MAISKNSESQTIPNRGFNVTQLIIFNVSKLSSQREISANTKLSIYFKQIYFKQIEIAAKIKQGFVFPLLENTCRRWLCKGKFQRPFKKLRIIANPLNLNNLKVRADCVNNLKVRADCVNNLKVRADCVNKDFKGFRGQNLSCKAQVFQKQRQPDI